MRGQLISILLKYGLYKDLLNYINEYKINIDFQNFDFSSSFPLLFAIIKELTDEKIILTLDEFDTILNIKSEIRDEFLGLLRTLKTKKKNGEINIIVNTYLKFSQLLEWEYFH
jgi:hypothetical protein